MNQKILDIIDRSIGKEGGYSFNKSDLGGETMWGITSKTARKYYKGTMKDMPRSLAVEIYLAEFFLEPHFDRVLEVSPDVAEKLFDCGINTGLGFTTPLIQDALNLLNRNGKDYASIKVDGVIGNNTIIALKAFLAKRGKDGEQVLLKLLNIMQGSRYVEITKARPANAEFLFGWIKNRVEI